MAYDPITQEFALLIYIDGIFRTKILLQELFFLVANTLTAFQSMIWKRMPLIDQS